MPGLGGQLTEMAINGEPGGPKLATMSTGMGLVVDCVGQLRSKTPGALVPKITLSRMEIEGGLASQAMEPLNSTRPMICAFKAGVLLGN